MAREDLTQSTLKELLHYNRSTGVWTWRVDRRGGAHAGDVAGTVDANGYVKIRVAGYTHQAHRLAFLYVKGELPSSDIEVDHKDCNPTNNRWKNLRRVRPVTNLENQRRAHSNNRTGYLGVRPSPTEGLYIAQITVRGKQMHLGTFGDPKIAHQAYLKAKRSFHKGNTL